MQRTIEATNYRRDKQLKYNAEHNIIPKAIIKPTREIIGHEFRSGKKIYDYDKPDLAELAADPVIKYMKVEALIKAIENTKKKKKEAATEIDFIEAARLRDEMYALQKILRKKEDEDAVKNNSNN